MPYNKLLISLIFFVLYQNIFSQKVWTLEDCIKHAYENNIQIKQQELNTNVKSLDLIQSKAALLPSLDASGSHSYNFGRTIDMYTNQFATSRVQSNNFYVSSGVTVFDGFKLLNTIKQNMLEKEAAVYDLEKMKNDISLTIATAYLQVLFNYEFLDQKQSQFDISKLQVKRTSILVEAGTLSKASLFEIQAQSASDELQYVNAKNQLDLSYLTLAQLLDLPSTDGFEIERPAINMSTLTFPVQTPEYIYSTSLTLQPEIKSAEIKLKSAQKGLSIARSSFSPSLSLRGSYGTGYSGASKEITDIILTGSTPIGYTQSMELVYGPTYDYLTQTKPFKSQLKDNLNQSIGLTMTIPLFNGLQSQTAVSKSKIAIENTNYILQNTKNQLNKNIQQAYADAKSANNRYLAAQKSVEANEESYKYVEQKFNLGMLNSIDYNDAKNKLSSARSELLQSKYEYLFRIKILDFYQGKPISIK